MNYLTSEKFSFHSRAVDEKTFGVVKFSGSEGLSRLYSFDIVLVAEDPNIDMDAMLQNRVVFSIHRSDGTRVPFNGILAQFNLIREVSGLYLYRGVMVPRLWSLTLTHHNQIFLDKTPQEIITSVLEEGGFSPSDYEFRLQNSYVTWEYACQYGESHYNFIARWMERNGMYYFFDQSGSSEKLVITDSKISHDLSPLGTKVVYAPVSGMETFHPDETVQSFTLQRMTVPQKVLLRDYNYRKPSLEVKGSAEVSESGHGEMYFYGDHFRTPEEGNKLASIRSEELLCQSTRFYGESTVPSLAPGYMIQLGNHFRQDMNRSYLVIAMEHYGNQAAALTSGLDKELAEGEQETVYRNTFTAIGDDVQFRPERVTDRPRLHGTINARIDATASGQYAELDEQGRYKVTLPFDLSGREGGKATTWIRMMQPYIGSDHGMHFPLHKGTEVLLTFIDGDPDRPIIAGAVANPDNPSQVTHEDQTMSKLTTGGGNKIHMQDQQGSEQIVLHTPGADTQIRMGMGSIPAGDFVPPDPTPPDPTPDPQPTPDKDSHVHWKGHADHDPAKVNEDGFFFSTGGSASFLFGINYEVDISGWSNKFIGGLEHTFILGGKAEEIIGGQSSVVIGVKHNVHVPKSWTIENETYKTGFKKLTTWAGKTFITKNKDSITDKEITIVEDVLNAYNESMTLVEDETEVVENKSEIVLEKEEVVENKNEIVIEVEEINSEKVEVSASKEEVTVEKVEVGTAKEEVNVEKTEVNVEKVESSEQKNEVGVEKNVVMTEIFFI